LDDHLAIGLPVCLLHSLVGCGDLAVLRLTGVRIEEVTIKDVSVAHVDHLFKPGDAIKHKEPALTEVVALVGRELKDLLDH